MATNMTYAGAGVDYGPMDAFKRNAQAAGKKTAANLYRFGFTEVSMSRGESVFLIETPHNYLAHVHEGLGTKNLVADAMYKLTGKSYYDHIAQDAVAMIVNDMITLGALPVSVAMHLGVGDSSWFEDEKQYSGLVEGYKKACNLSGCVWGPGETPTLKDIIVPGTCELSGSAMGIIEPKERRITGNIEEGDRIIFLGSSGIHANGLTMAREIVQKLPEGYLTKLSDGRTYGEALLDPTYLYVSLIEECLKCGINIHYTVNLTGHGWRKLMRTDQPFAYVVEQLPIQLPIFEFIQKHGPVNDKEAYATFNMGAGFALYMPEEDRKKLWSLIPPRHDWYWLKAFNAGYIEKSQHKKVVIEPKGIEFLGETLKIR